jgi:hypothetical protein
MASITLSGFAGELPKVEPEYLPAQNAVAVTGARLQRGSLDPMRQDAAVHTLGGAADSIYLHNGVWMSWNEDVDAVPGPVAEDRLYITRATGSPQMVVAGVTYDLALPRPSTAPGVSRTGTLNPKLALSVSYTYSWLTSLGEESAPAPLSVLIDWSNGCGIDVAMGASPVPPGRLITHRRIYRTTTSLEGVTDLYFVEDVPLGSTTYFHDPVVAPLQEAITSMDYDPAPNGLRGLTVMANGIMAGFVGKEVFFCEPFRPHAWPRKYTLTTNAPIVGLAAFGSTLAVLTTGVPFLIQGLHPDSMAMDKLEQGLPCLSKRGIVDVGGAAIYPSTNGLVQITETGGVQMISQPLWDREQWLALAPATFRASHFMGRYAFSHQPVGSATRKMGFFDLTGEIPFLIPVETAFLDLLHDQPTGRMLCLAANGVDIVSFDDGAAPWREYSWKSKPHVLTGNGVTFSVTYVRARPPVGGSPVFSMEIIADGVVIHTISATNKIERIPAVLAESWQVRVMGNCTVTRVIFADNADEVLQ